MKRLLPLAAGLCVALLSGCGERSSSSGAGSSPVDSNPLTSAAPTIVDEAGRITVATTADGITVGGRVVAPLPPNTPRARIDELTLLLDAPGDFRGQVRWQLGEGLTCHQGMSVLHALARLPNAEVSLELGAKKARFSPKRTDLAVDTTEGLTGRARPAQYFTTWRVGKGETTAHSYPCLAATAVGQAPALAEHYKTHCLNDCARPRRRVAIACADDASFARVVELLSETQTALGEIPLEVLSDLPCGPDDALREPGATTPPFPALPTTKGPDLGRGRVRRTPISATGGAPTVDLVKKAMAPFYASAQDCYDLGLTRNPGLTGRATLELDVSPLGGVAAIRAMGDLPDPWTKTCVQRAFARMPLPARDGGYQVTIPLVFVSKN